jgi:hypothetical protein
VAPDKVPILASELRKRETVTIGARVDPRRTFREAKATGQPNLPRREFKDNQAWLQTVLTAVDLICWTKQICLADAAELARCEIAAFRYRVLHVAARLTRSARQLRLRIDKTWRWAAQIAEGFDRLRAEFA